MDEEKLDTTWQLSQLSALDWIAVALTVLISLGVMLAPWLVTPRYASMYGAFGGELHPFTQMVLGPWFCVLVGFVPLAVLVPALFLRRSLGFRRAMIVAAFLLGVLVVSIVYCGLRLPLYELAGAISE